MSVTFEESWESRSISQPESGTGTATRIWWAFGDPDPDTVYTAAIADATLMADFGTLPANQVQVEPVSLSVCKVTVTHGALEPGKSLSRTNTEPEPLVSTGDYTFTFSTTGGTFHITEAKSQTAYGTNAPSVGNTIGWQRDGAAEGVDIVIPQLQFTVRKRMASATLTDSYIRTLAELTGKTNSSTFLGWAAGEVLFLGAEGQQSASDTEITFQFAASRNLSSSTVAGITVTSKGGHDYLWVKYKDKEGTNAIEPEAEGVYVAKVYDSGDFSGLSI